MDPLTLKYTLLCPEQVVFGAPVVLILSGLK